jgi:pimeloyl-ACP methyl ester carboxylesterase
MASHTPTVGFVNFWPVDLVIGQEVGMGKSDNPDIGYRFFDHAEYLEAFIDEIGLWNITLVVHDWGSALGFHFAMRHESNVKGLAFMEAILLPVPSWEMFHPDLKAIFQGFRTPDRGWDMIFNKNMFIEQVLPVEATGADRTMLRGKHQGTKAREMRVG